MLNIRDKSRCDRHQEKFVIKYTAVDHTFISIPVTNSIKEVYKDYSNTLLVRVNMWNVLTIHLL